MYVQSAAAALGLVGSVGSLVGGEKEREREAEPKREAMAEEESRKGKEREGVV